MKITSVEQLEQLVPPPKKPESMGAPHLITSVEELERLVPPPKKQSSSPWDDMQSVASSLGGNSGDINAARQASTTGAAENMADITSLFAKIGLATSLNLKARDNAAHQQELLAKADPDNKIGGSEFIRGALATVESSLLGDFALGALGAGVPAVKAATTIGKNDKILKRGGKALLSALPAGAAFGAITASPNQSIASGAATGAALTPLGVGFGMALGKLLQFATRSSAVRRLANETSSSKTIEQLERTLSDNKGKRVVLGSAIGNPDVKKEELDVLSSVPGFAEKSNAKLDEITKNLNKEAEDITKRFGVDGEAHPEIAKDLKQKIMAHSDKEQKTKRKLWSQAGNLAKKSGMKVKLSSFTRLAKKENKNISKVEKGTGVESTADDTLGMLQNIIRTTDNRSRIKDLKKDIGKASSQIDKDMAFLDDSNKEIAKKKRALDKSTARLGDKKKAAAAARAKFEENVLDDGNRKASNKAANKYFDELNKNDELKADYRAFKENISPSQKEARERIEELQKANDKSLDQLMKLPIDHEIDLDVADLTRHSLNEQLMEAKSARNKGKERIYSLLLSALNKDIDKSLENAPQEVREAHELAMEHYKEKIVPLMEDPLNKIINGKGKKKFDIDKIADTFMPLSKGGKKMLNQLKALIDHVPGSAELLLKHAFTNVLEEDENGLNIVNANKVKSTINQIGKERMDALLGESSLKPEKSEVKNQLKTFTNNMANGEAAFGRTLTPPTGERNKLLIISARLMNYWDHVIGNLASKNFSRSLYELGYPASKFARWHALLNTSKTLEDIIKLKKGQKIKEDKLYLAGKLIKKGGKYAGLYATKFANQDDQDDN